MDDDDEEHLFYHRVAEARSKVRKVMLELRYSPVSYVFCSKEVETLLIRFFERKKLYVEMGYRDCGPNFTVIKWPVPL